MLRELYEKLDDPAILARDITLPKMSHDALYLSDFGELYCYQGICLKKNYKELIYNSWPYYTEGKHTHDIKEQMLGMYRLKHGHISLSPFIDCSYNSDMKVKQLKDYFVKMPVINDTYYGVIRRATSSDGFKENTELTRACFGLTHNELNSLLLAYSVTLGESNLYTQYPKLTR